jgi:hypothetical protein
MLGGTTNGVVLIEVIILLKHTKFVKNLFLCILCFSSDQLLLFLKAHETFLRLLSAYLCLRKVEQNKTT